MALLNRGDNNGGENNQASRNILIVIGDIEDREAVGHCSDNQSAQPVSYPPLDVYKRQLLGRVERAFTREGLLPKDQIKNLSLSVRSRRKAMAAALCGALLVGSVASYASIIA